MKMCCFIKASNRCKCKDKNDVDEEDKEDENPPARKPISKNYSSTEPLVGASSNEKGTNFQQASVEDEDEIKPVSVDPLEGHSNVGRPLAREGKSNLDEIIALEQALREGGHVRSPSGNILDAAAFMARKDRPKLMPERQENIRRNVEEANRKEEERKAAVLMEKQAIEAMTGWKGWRSCWGCFGEADEDD